jgi:hypothetical protein
MALIDERNLQARRSGLKSNAQTDIARSDDNNIIAFQGWLLSGVPQN